MENITLTGIDLSKSVFEVRCENRAGRLVDRKTLNRDKLFRYLELLPKGSQVAMEACGSSHYWGKQVAGLGLKPVLITPQFVKAFRMSQKNDKNDATAICEAARRPGMRPVTLKNDAQLDMQARHRARERMIENRTKLINQIRAFLLERGITIPLGVSQFIKRMPGIVEELGEQTDFGSLISDSWAEFKQRDEDLAKCTRKIKAIARSNEDCRKIMGISGVGEIVATALVAFVGKAEGFKNGRCLSAALGLVPRQYSTGGKTVLGGITKVGNGYIRKLLVHGARSVIFHTRMKKKEDKESLWIRTLYQRCGANRTAVAVANKIARKVWLVLRDKPPYTPSLPMAA